MPDTKNLDNKIAEAGAVQLGRLFNRVEKQLGSEAADRLRAAIPITETATEIASHGAAGVNIVEIIGRMADGNNPKVLRGLIDAKEPAGYLLTSLGADHERFYHAVLTGREDGRSTANKAAVYWKEPGNERKYTPDITHE